MSNREPRKMYNNSANETVIKMKNCEAPGPG
jgi:hypothetical protein